MDAYQFIVARLDGDGMKDRMGFYEDLVSKGIAGFIVFGGEIETLRAGIRALQEQASAPLIVCSDLEQGLGQQVRGGTTFPPARAISESGDPGLAGAAFRQMAEEAAYAGINVILAPVLDVDLNPANPIISTRSFGRDPESVSSLGALMIREFRKAGIKSCGKHFPGHGDTSVDSHIGQPVIRKTIAELEGSELVPFRRAVSEGVDMIMLGHLNVPAMDPSLVPASLSAGAVRYLREEMGFKGLTVTDALNMGGLGEYSGSEAAMMALDAGVDVLLHPSDPEGLARAIERRTVGPDPRRLLDFRRSLMNAPSDSPPPPGRDVSLSLTAKSILVEGSIRTIRNPYVVLLCDDEPGCGSALVEGLSGGFPDLRHISLNNAWQASSIILPEDIDLIVCVFSKVRAWKGGRAPWVYEALETLSGRAAVTVSFGSPHAIDRIGGDHGKVYAWWGSEEAQAAVSRLLARGA